MNERQQWMKRLDEFLVYVEATADTPDPANVIADLRSVVGRWIAYSLEQRVPPGDREDAFLNEWVTSVLDIQAGPQGDYRARVRRWWRWCEGNSSLTPRRAGTEQHIDIAMWMTRLEEYLSYLRHRGRQQRTITDRHRKLSKWIRFACGTERNPAAWDPAALDEAFVMWDTVDSTPQRDRYRARIQAWCKYWRDHGSDSVNLEDLVQRFRDEGYPDEQTEEHREARAEFEGVLRSLPNLSYEQRGDLKFAWNQASNGYDYGGVGNTLPIDRAVLDVTEEDWPWMRDRIYALCFGEGDLDARFDEAVTYIDELGPVRAARFLAIAQPERFMPNFWTRNRKSDRRRPGKIDVIDVLLRLDLLDAKAADTAQELVRSPESSYWKGELAVRSNDLLLEVLRPWFTEDDGVDTFGMVQFLYWLAERYADGDDGLDDDDESNESDDGTEHLAVALADASEELLCEVGFLNDIVELLKDKGQVILYGPPGTGKTYFARSLAWALTGIQDDAEYEDDGPYSLVQFHPAYSYEDFFEGFRPSVDDDGNMTYRLTPGPLVKLAELAEVNPDQRHVMVIDEINRANLPRVLGELLYLLEYRDEWTQTQYRPVDGFTLPSNLWFIGTMNTADRSIALIDAAMRRRFHFVPFFPDREPTAGLLERWCEQNEPGQAWIADLLNGVNERLLGDLGGDYMLIGPSHFMKGNLNKDSLRRIWEYNIEPLIEDQFFGRQDVIDSYRFNNVWRRHGPSATASDSGAGTPGEAVENAEPQSGHDEGTASQGAE